MGDVSHRPPVAAHIKPLLTPGEAVARIPSGSVVLVGGFTTGRPEVLLAALARSEVTDLTIVHTAMPPSFNPLFGAGKVRKVISSFGSAAARRKLSVFEESYLRGEVEFELIPQGTLAERLHAGAAGVPAFYIGTGADTVLAVGKEQRTFGGETFVLEHAIRGAYALIHANTADAYGNLTYRLGTKNFNVVMALAADHVLCEAEHVVPIGGIEPDRVDTPGMCVDAVVPLGPAREGGVHGAG